MTISDNLLNRKATPKIKVRFFLLFKIVPLRSNAASLRSAAFPLQSRLNLPTSPPRTGLPHLPLYIKITENHDKSHIKFL